GATLRLNGSLSGSVGLTKTGVGVLDFGGSVGNTYSGTTTVAAGTNTLNKTAGNCFNGPLVVGDNSGAVGSAVVQMLQATQIPTVDVTINSDGLFDLNDFAETVSDLTLDGGTARSGITGTSAALTVTGAIFVNGGDSTISGLLSVSTGTRN